MNVNQEMDYLLKDLPNEFFINNYKFKQNASSYHIYSPAGILLGCWNLETSEWSKWNGYGFSDISVINREYIEKLVQGIRP